MKNCPNCNAPINTNTCKCEYCGTYYFDFSGLDLNGSQPCFIKISNAVLKAIPYMKTIEQHIDCDDCRDIYGRVHRLYRKPNISMDVVFDVIEYKEGE